MTSTIAHSGGLISPEVVDGYEATREVRTIVHPILGRSDPDITFRPAGLRAGTLKLVFGTGAAAEAAEAVLVVPQVFALSDSSVPEVSMSFVVGPEGQATTRALDAPTRKVWVVEVPFQEVSV